MPADEIVDEQRDGCVCMGNSLVEVVFDLRAGTYRIADRRDPAACIRDVRYSIADKCARAHAARPGARRTWSIEPVTGPIGDGRRLTVTTTAPDTPDLVLAVELYEGRPFVVLGGGVDNRTGCPVRLCRVHPVAGAAFQGLDVSDRFAALDGNGGVAHTAVWREGHLKCWNNLLVRFGSPCRCLVLGGLTYHDFEKFAEITRRDDRIDVDLWSEDPVGRRVDPGERYVPDDRYYVDIVTRDPFEALELYARAVRSAQGIELSTYDFPTVCLWWAGQAGEPDNDTPGAVREMDHVRDSGFGKYCRVGIRLIPDCYEKDNFDGWWDDEHWRMHSSMFGSIGPCYKPPYETTEKWCRAIIDRGGVPITYMRTSARSEDYCLAHPAHVLFNDPHQRVRHPVGPRWWEGKHDAMLVGYDFTDPDFIRHMREVYNRLRAAGVAGIFFDYPKLTGWNADGGFEDPRATTAAAYRNIFALAREGLGQPCFCQERNYYLGSDVTLGLVASQRTIWDNTTFSPPIISRAGLRWYKNRLVIHYDTDGKQIVDEASRNGRDGVRAMLTMSYVASGRLLLACSFSQLTPEQVFDLSRVCPFHAAARSARPVDLFSGSPHPRVYDFRVDETWHQLTFYNTAVASGDWPDLSFDQMDFERRQAVRREVLALRPVAGTVEVDLGASAAEGGLGLDRTARHHVYDFWNDRFVGTFAGSDRLAQDLRPAEARMMSVHAVEDHPQFLSTNRHIMQGYVDMARLPVWDADRRELSAVSNVIGGETYKVVIAGNGYSAVSCSAEGAEGRIRPIDEAAGLLELSLDAEENRPVAWSVTFGPPWGR